MWDRHSDRRSRFQFQIRTLPLLGRTSDTGVVAVTLTVLINRGIPINQAMNTETPFEKFLNQHDEEAWSATLATLLRSIHEVDRNATQIWFAFYPLSLFRALQQADDRDKLAQQ